MFLLVGVIAGALNVAGVAAVATQIAWILFLIGIVSPVIHLVTGRTAGSPDRADSPLPESTSIQNVNPCGCSGRFRMDQQRIQ